MAYQEPDYDFNVTGETPKEAFGIAMRFALVFGAIALGAAVLTAPLMQNAADLYAENRGFGIDRVLTGSIDKPERYTVRKSVLTQRTERICGVGNVYSCDPN